MTFLTFEDPPLELVVTRLEGLTLVTLRGPVTRASPEAFVAKLARLGAIALEPSIPAAIKGDHSLVSRRSSSYITEPSPR